MKTKTRAGNKRAKKDAAVSVGSGRLLGEAEARREMKAGMIIAAIKIIRDRNKLPLREAMDIVQGWLASSNTEMRNAHTSGGGDQ